MPSACWFKWHAHEQWLAYTVHGGDLGPKLIVLNAVSLEVMYACAISRWSWLTSEWGWAGKHFVCAHSKVRSSDDELLEVHDISTGAARQLPVFGPLSVPSAHHGGRGLSPNVTHAVHADADNQVRAYSSLQGKWCCQRAYPLSPPQAFVRVAWTDDSSAFAFHSDAHCIRVVDVASWNVTAEIAIDAVVQALSWTTDGSMLIVVMTSRERVWSHSPSRSQHPETMLVSFADVPVFQLWN